MPGLLERSANQPSKRNGEELLSKVDCGLASIHKDAGARSARCPSLLHEGLESAQVTPPEAAGRLDFNRNLTPGLIDYEVHLVAALDIPKVQLGCGAMDLEDGCEVLCHHQASHSPYNLAEDLSRSWVLHPPF